MARHPSVKGIGQRIREVRERRGLTGEKLAKKIGSDKGTISRIESGQAGLSVDRLQAIADALGIDPAEVLAPPPRRASNA